MSEKKNLAPPHLRDLGRSNTSLTHVDSHPTSLNEKSKAVEGTPLSARLHNPLLGKSEEELFEDVDKFIERTGLTNLKQILRKGALVAQDMDNFERLGILSEEEKASLREEKTNKWRQTKMLYWIVFANSMAAVVQGMDETVINGANIFYPAQFGIGGTSQQNVLLVGLTNSAPYLCSAVFSCWLTYPLNKYFGRRGTIFISTLCAGLGCIWGALTNTWWHLFISRLFLGIGIGPKSATVSIFSAEISPARIRGALTMQWQVWTAFGIMMGTVSSLIFQNVPDKPGITGLNWRLMLGSACLPAIFVCLQVFFCVESPRWLIGKGRWQKAWESFRALRRSEIIAARDLYYTAVCIEAEDEVANASAGNKVLELVTVPRNRRAVLASSIVMFGQQFCGVNAIAYYSSNIFLNAGSSQTSALLGSFGFGLLNWVFALPAAFTIDSFGRRSLLLFTFPFLCVTMVLAGCGFIINDPKAQLGVVTLGIYLFTCFYSSGSGPVPFLYSAEVYPLQTRELGMALATATTWFFNFVVALTFPLLLVSFGNTGAFLWFAAWNALLFFLVLLFCPETKQYTLEELDEVFSMRTGRQATYGLQTPWYQFQRVILRRKVHRTPLYEFNPSEEKDQATISHREHA